MSNTRGIDKAEYDRDRDRRLDPDKLKPLTNCVLRIINAERAPVKVSGVEGFAIECIARVIGLSDPTESGRRNSRDAIFAVGEDIFGVGFSGDNVIVDGNQEVGYVLGDSENPTSEPAAAQAAIEHGDKAGERATPLRPGRILALV